MPTQRDLKLVFSCTLEKKDQAHQHTLTEFGRQRKGHEQDKDRCIKRGKRKRERGKMTRRTSEELKP